MGELEFRSFFNEYAYPRLKHRQDSFQYIFNYLYSKNRPVFIVETGCVRTEENWEGDGQSTILFDKFAEQVTGSLVLSVDIDKKATQLCRTLVSDSTKIHDGDSVAFLRKLVNSQPKNFDYIDLLYLDSYDCDLSDVHPSALHHMKELISAKGMIGAETLIVIDDSPVILIPEFDGDSVIFKKEITGKGRYIADYANNVGVSPVFSSYQIGFIGL